MVPSPKTTCTRCGAGILQITADLTGGHCMPCAKAQARDDSPLLELQRRRYPDPLLDHRHPAENVILSVGYHPGWSPDLTSWVIQIAADGLLRQAMLWHRERGNEAELLAPVTLAQTDFVAIQKLVESCTPESFRCLTDGYCMDDAAEVSLVMPGQGVKATFAYFAFEHDRKTGRWSPTEAEAAAFRLFRQIWRFADRHAPHTLSDHEKRRP
jgi:hypothetical protein